MKKFARFLSVTLALALMLCCMGGLVVSAEESAEEYTLFIAYGGDKEAENDWGWQYYGSDVEGITATNATIKSGETATISLTFATPNVNSWFFAPCLVGEDVSSVSNVDFTIVCKIDGVEVPVNMEADAEGKTWWTEGTGDYTAEQCIRLAGGYNEWATKYIAEPAGFTTIEYTITLNSVELGVKAAPGEAVVSESTDEYTLFIAYGGDKEAENDWGWQYYGSDVEGITATNATIKSGETATISLTFATPNVNSWFFAPCLVGEDVSSVSNVDFTIVCKIDGVEVPVNMEADAEGKTWWTEGTGDYTAEQCIRLAGGYNEWATKYIDEPAGFTTIEYTITLNSVEITTVTEPAEPTVVEIDKNGTYNAYLMLQTPNWTFRDAHDSANGIGSEVWGQHITNNDSGVNYGVVTDAVIAGNGTYTVSITDFGTIFADDFAAAGQEYFNILAVSTDLPAGANVTVTDVNLIIDGQVRHTYPEAYINTESNTSLQILVQNIWNSDVKEISYYPTPTQSLEIQFTISGFDYDAEPAVEETEPVEETTEAPTEAPTTEATEPVEETKGNGGNTVAIVIIVIGIVAAVAVVVVLQKKKGVQ